MIVFPQFFLAVWHAVRLVHVTQIVAEVEAKRAISTSSPLRAEDLEIYNTWWVRSMLAGLESLIWECEGLRIVLLAGYAYLEHMSWFRWNACLFSRLSHDGSGSQTNESLSSQRPERTNTSNTLNAT